MFRGGARGEDDPTPGASSAHLWRDRERERGGFWKVPTSSPFLKWRLFAGFNGGGGGVSFRVMGF